MPVKKSLHILETMNRPGCWLEQNMRTIKKNKRLEAGVATLPDGHNIFIKRYFISRLWPDLTSRFIKRKVNQVMLISNRLIQAGVSLPQPLLSLHDFIIQPPSIFFISQALEGVHSLRRPLQDSQPHGKPYLYNLLDRIGENTARMHKAGIVHKDLKGTNIMVDSSSEPQVYFIDFDAARQINFPQDPLFARDLARLALEIAENQPDQKILSCLLSSYSHNTGIAPQELRKKMKPYYDQLCLKHKKKYGRAVPGFNQLFSD